MSGVLAVEAVTNRLKTVVSCNVWNTLASPTDPGAFQDRYSDGTRIHAYEVTREGSVPDETKDIAAIKRIESVVVYAFMSYQAGVSEPLFQAEIDAICAAFDPPSARTFGANSGVEWSQAPRVEGPRIGRFGQYLVHFARITILVEFDPIF